MYDLKEYCDKNNVEMNEDSLYEYIRILVLKHKTNNRIIRGLLFRDNSITTDDIIMDLYMTAIERFRRTNVYNIVVYKSDLINLFKRADREKRKHNGQKEFFDVYIDEKDDIEIEDRLMLESMLDTLNDEQRDLLRMYYVEGLTYQIIADRVGLTKDGVKKKIGKILDDIKR